MADLSKEPPTDINPYEVLQLDTTASPSDVKSAYKKLALKHHPDKVQPHDRDSAHARFQEIAFAYAILSDDRRRQRYDTTGNTSESLEIEDDDFNWGDFFKAQWAEAVTVGKLNDFKTTYKHSEEERQDILAAYKVANGDLDTVYTRVMLSNPLDDEDRFRDIINDAIATGEVEAHKTFTHESADKKKRRHQRACGEGREAEEYAKKLGVWEELFGSAKNSPKSKAKDADAGLMELIQKRKRGASSQFLDDLEAKYGGGQRKGKKQKFEEPPEELFQKNSRKMQKTAKDEAEVEDDEDKVDLEAHSPESDEEEDEEEEKLEPAKSKSKGAKGAKKTNMRNAKRGLYMEDDGKAKRTRSNGKGIKGAAKKRSSLKDDSLGPVSEVDDEGDDFAPAKLKSKSAKGRPIRSPRNAKKTSYAEAESSGLDFEEAEEEQELKPAKSNGQGSSRAKRGKGRTMAVRKK